MVTGALLVAALVSGVVTLVTTHGVSMWPRFHSGDLAVLIPSSHYRVGEIVGYHSPLLHLVVLHRIVALHNGLFSFKGDHNNFIDPTQLPASAIQGRMWLHVPHAGTVLGWLRTPLSIGVMTAGIVSVAVFDQASRRRRARARHAGGTARLVDGRREPPVTRAAPSRAGQPRVDVLPGSVPARYTERRGTSSAWVAVGGPVLLCALFVVGAVSAWVQPTTRPSHRPANVSESVAFGYTAHVAPGVAYPTGLVSTGDPIFLRLVHVLTMQARYALTPPLGASADVRGSLSADVVLQGPGGWTGVLAHGTPVTVSEGGRPVSTPIAVPVDLSRIAALTKAFTTETGMSLGSAQVVMEVRANVHGTVAGEPVSDTYSPSLALQVVGEELNLASASAAGSPATYPELSASRSDPVTVSVHAPAHVQFLGRQFSVVAARQLCLVGAVVTWGIALFGMMWVKRRRHMDEGTRLRTLHRHDLVPVTTSPATPDRHVIDVESPYSLGRLADRYDCVILELRHALGASYYVECGATVYRFGSEPEVLESEPAVFEHAPGVLVDAAMHRSPVG